MIKQLNYGNLVIKYTHKDDGWDHYEIRGNMGDIYKVDGTCALGTYSCYGKYAERISTLDSRLMP